MTGLTVTRFSVKSAAAATPQGTAGAQLAVLTAGSCRLRSDVTRARLPGGIAMAIEFFANRSGRLTDRAATALAIDASDAVARTSTGAPAFTCSTSCGLPPKLKRTLVPGYRFSKPAAMTGRTSVSDAAAETTMIPCGRACAAVETPEPTIMVAVMAIATAPTVMNRLRRIRHLRARRRHSSTSRPLSLARPVPGRAPLPIRD